MSTRDHVGQAFVRTLQRPGNWPTLDLSQLRNRVLDEAGGDHRIHVAFLVHLAELAVPQAIADAATSPPRPWEVVRNGLSLRLAAEYFLLPDMVRWGIDCWGVALGVPGASIGRYAGPSAGQADLAASGHDATPAPSPALAGNPGRSRAPVVPAGGGLPPSRARASHASSGAAPGRASRSAVQPAGTAPRAARAGVPSWVKPGKVPAVPRWMAGSQVAAHGHIAVGGLQHVERQALIVIGSLMVLALVVMRSTGDRPPDAAPGSVDAGSHPAEGAHAPRVDSGPPLRYRLIVHQPVVEGERRCDSIAARIRWRDERIEELRLSSDGRRFAFPGRPGLEGTIEPGGAFTSRVVDSERDGTRSAFRMWGRMSTDGFRAVAETRTTTLLRWREELRCRFVSEIDGARLIAPVAVP